VSASRGILGGLMAVLLAVFAAAALAQPAYPSKPVRFIVPYAAGGSVDPLVRLFTPKLSESLGQQVVVDIRPGGNTIIGTDALAKSPPDGHTILATVVTNHVINALLIPNLPFDSVKDFTPVATVSNTDYVLVLHPSVPARNLKEFIALAKSKPGQLNYGSVGSGGISQLGNEHFSMLVGIKMQRVPYKGSALALIDLVAGQLQAGFYTPISFIQYMRSGRLKAIAVSGNNRLQALPEVPTFTEAGLPGFEMRVTYGVLAPAGTAKPIIDKLSGEFAKIVALPETRERLSGQGMVPFYTGPDAMAALMKTDTVKYAQVIKAANIKLEN
jgi:tripartite-type tricarboxylate transporter receptor subunit TctC